MASYSIVFKPSVEKDLRSIPTSVIARLIKKIEVLRSNPYPHQSIKLSSAERLYRLRVGDYRIVYGVDDKAKQIIVQYVRHRREIYRGL
jgi:mRNA interferase RelE/StbE